MVDDLKDPILLFGDAFKAGVRSRTIVPQITDSCGAGHGAAGQSREKRAVRRTHYGGKSGKPYEVTIWFVVVDGEPVFLRAANCRCGKGEPELENVAELEKELF